MEFDGPGRVPATKVAAGFRIAAAAGEGVRGGGWGWAPPTPPTRAGWQPKGMGGGSWSVLGRANEDETEEVLGCLEEAAGVELKRSGGTATG